MTARSQGRESLLQVDLFPLVHGDDLGRGRNGPLQAGGGALCRQYDRATFERRVRGIEQPARSDERDRR